MMKNILISIFMVLSLTTLAEELNFKSITPQEDTQYIIRPVYGKATYSTLGSLISLQENLHDEQGGTLNGIQLEKYFAKDLLENSVDLTIFSSMFIHRQKIKDPSGSYTSPIALSGKDALQFNMGFKAYWKNFPWNQYVRTRFGVGEGLSYVDKNLDIEIQNTNKKDRKAISHLLNYLDFTLAFNLKDITSVKNLENSYAGVGISHRSGIFGLINGVNGGSNYYTFFIETEF